MPILDTKTFGHHGAVVLVIVPDIDERDAAPPLDEHIAPGELDGSAVEGAVRDEALRRFFPRFIPEWRGRPPKAEK